MTTRFSTPCFKVIVELGHPEQLPCKITVTIPFLNSLNFISPPSLATAGLIFVSNNLIICFSISFNSLLSLLSIFSS